MLCVYIYQYFFSAYGCGCFLSARGSRGSRGSSDRQPRDCDPCGHLRYGGVRGSRDCGPCDRLPRGERLVDALCRLCDHRNGGSNTVAPEPPQRRARASGKKK